MSSLSNDFTQWLNEVSVVYRSLDDPKKICLLETLLAASGPSQMYMLSKKLPDLVYRDFITLLPPEIVATILKFLSGEQLLSCCLVNRAWNERISSLSPVWSSMLQGCGVILPIATHLKETANNLELVQKSDKELDQEKKYLYCHTRRVLNGFSRGLSIDIQEDFIDKGTWRVTSVKYHKGNILTGCDDHTVQIWSVPDGRVLSTVCTHSVCCLTITDKYLYTASFNANAECWDLTTGFHSRTFSGHTSAVLAIDVTEDECYLLTGSVDKTAKLWDLRRSDAEKLLKTFDDIHEDWVFQVKFLQNNNKELLFVTCDANVICLWRTDADGHILSYSHVRAEVSTKFTSFYHTSDNFGYIFSSSWIEASKSSYLCMYSVLPNLTKIDKVMSFKIELDNIKAFLLGAGTRFAVIMCSISRKDFHILDVVKQTVIATIATPDFYVLPRNGSTITLCDTSWLNGFQFSKMKHNTPVFAAGIYLNKVMLGTWSKFVSHMKKS